MTLKIKCNSTINQENGREITASRVFHSILLLFFLLFNLDYMPSCQIEPVVTLFISLFLRTVHAIVYSANLFFFFFFYFSHFRLIRSVHWTENPCPESRWAPMRSYANSIVVWQYNQSHTCLYKLASHCTRLYAFSYLVWACKAVEYLSSQCW